MTENHVKKLAIMGGTYNPIHKGHLLAAREIARLYAPDLVFFIPTGIPPHKQPPGGHVEPEHRLAMVRLALEGEEGFDVSDIETKRTGKSYTVDTLKQLALIYPGSEMILVMGTDMLLTFEQWKDFETICALCRIAALPREAGDAAKMRRAARRLERRWGARVDVPDITPLEISSTEIREMVARGEDTSLYLPAAVRDYIDQNGLYRP